MTTDKNLPPEVSDALAVLRQHQRSLESEEFGEENAGFDTRSYLQLEAGDQWQRPNFPTHTQMERTVPGVGTIPFFRQRAYQYREYPKMMYHANGNTKTVSRKSEEQELVASDENWFDHPDKAAEAKAEAELVATKRGPGRPRKEPEIEA